MIRLPRPLACQESERAQTKYRLLLQSAYVELQSHREILLYLPFTSLFGSWFTALLSKPVDIAFLVPSLD